MKRVLVGLSVALLTVLAFGASARAATPFDFVDFETRLADGDDAVVTEAGSHPQTYTTEFEITTEEDEVTPSGNIRNLTVDLPPGLVGNATAVPECPKQELRREACPFSTQIGYIQIQGFGAFPGQPGGFFPVFNLDPPENLPAQFGFNPGNPIYLDPHLRSESDYGISVSVRNANETLGVRYSRVVMWGVPADPGNDKDRGWANGGAGSFCGEIEDPGCSNPAQVPVRSFMTLPTNCSPNAVGDVTRIQLESWAGDVATEFYENEDGGVPAPTTGCEDVPFSPSMSFKPTSVEADSPTGVDVTIRLPQGDVPKGIQQSHVKRVAVTLPEGMAVNPSSVGRLDSCSAEQVGLDRRGPAFCPDGSKLGTVEIETPLLAEPLSGSIYLARQGDNPFGSLLALYIVAEGPGVFIKLPGEVRTDPATGRVEAIFDNTPQLPFSELTTSFKSGPRAALVNPPSCGSKEVRAELTPWARPNQPVVYESSFLVTQGPQGSACPAASFGPQLLAGSPLAAAGAFSPFEIQITRADGTQRIRDLTLALPEGMLGKLAGIPYCSEAALASISGSLGTGGGQIAVPSCPAASLVGTVTVGAGSGPNPFYLQTGRAYLAGPYRGAPLSLAVVSPVVAGPFDLGNVVVRNALHVDPVTARVTAKSDPLPLVIHGIPLNMRDIRVSVDRPGFMLNPTSCDRTSSVGTFSSEQGAGAAAASPYQAVNCDELRFRPRLALKLTGPTHRSAHPKLRATLRMPRRGANIAKAQVTMPKTQFLEQGHIRTICTRVQYAAKACPKGSVYGYAKAWTPLLDKPLQGPVYLRSSSNPLPDLVADLDGQIEIDLAGRIDSVDERLRATFWAVPDAPVTKFVLNMQGGRKGLLVNNTDICRTKPRASVSFDAQNGKVTDSKSLVRTSCPKRQGKRVSKAPDK